MGQKTQPTVSKHWRKRSPKDQASIPLGPPHCADNNTTFMQISDINPEKSPNGFIFSWSTKQSRKGRKAAPTGQLTDTVQKNNYSPKTVLMMATVASMYRQKSNKHHQNTMNTEHNDAYHIKVLITQARHTGTIHLWCQNLLSLSMFVHISLIKLSATLCVPQNLTLDWPKTYGTKCVAAANHLNTIINHATASEHHNRPVFGCLPEPNRAWLLVVYFSRQTSQLSVY